MTEGRRATVKRLLKPSLNWLLVVVPIGLGLQLAHSRGTAWVTPTWIFIASCLAVVPLAGWMGRATENLAEQVGAGIGGLLNATFGNAAELIIALLFLVDGLRHPEKIAYNHSVVKASLTGSIIGNMLLVLGASLLTGGIRHPVQTFNVTAARSGASMLLLAAVSLVVPAAFRTYEHNSNTVEEVGAVSLEIALVLLVIYLLSLFFSLRTHKHLYLGEVGEGAAGWEAGEERGAHWPLRKSLTVLLVSAALVGVMSELLVGSVEEASHALGMSKLFVGVVVVAVIGNAAEHSTAIMMALRNQMDLALGIAIGSSIQIALFVAPILVFASYALGQPMSLVFEPPEVLAVVLSVLVVSQICGDGESNWLEGAQLLSVYAILGMLFYYL